MKLTIVCLTALLVTVALAQGADVTESKGSMFTYLKKGGKFEELLKLSADRKTVQLDKAQAELIELRIQAITTIKPDFQEAIALKEKQVNLLKDNLDILNALISGDPKIIRALYEKLVKSK